MTADHDTVTVFPGTNGEWFVRLRAGNGQTTFISEGYTRKWSAKRAARRVARMFGVDRVAEVWL